jgi:hypothetical protein
MVTSELHTTTNEPRLNIRATTIMSSLAAVDANGVRQRVIDTLEAWRQQEQEASSRTYNRFLLAFDGVASQRDAEYVVECFRVLPQQERIAERTSLF